MLIDTAILNNKELESVALIYLKRSKGLESINQYSLAASAALTHKAMIEELEMRIATINNQPEEYQRIWRE